MELSLPQQEALKVDDQWRRMFHGLYGVGVGTFPGKGG
jgi:hypothetical protein